LSSASFPIVSRFVEPADSPERAERAAHAANDAARLRAVVEREHAFVWRSLRRLGVATADVDDAVQKVFLVTARRLAEVPADRERSFLFATAMRIAANERRAERRKRSAGPDALDAMRCDHRSPEQAAADRALLDTLLDPLPLELRSVLVLFELEQLTAGEIAGLLELPVGTVASRLRRAREMVDAAVRRHRAAEGSAR